ncbi:Thioredoxin-like protein [Mycena sanguinolenta]|uniref:Thioredoxin-like protein n=1 Tax=Mycena sanguinolenta TaxID=230812 RepID=A0A8H6ZCN0_9AGAR|nr:Thioredoxin-like protein [Mycena sanguinolenta]
MDSKKRLSPSGASPIRRRRFIIVVVALLCFIYFFGSPFRIPAALKDVSGLSRAKIVHLVKGSKGQPSVKVDEIFGLLNLVTGDSEHEHILGHTEGFDPTKPIDMGLYAAGKDDLDWNQRVNELNERYPLVVFSKTYCPYVAAPSTARRWLLTCPTDTPSARKPSLRPMNFPRPQKSLRSTSEAHDAIQLKTVLTRLTHHSTFPNIVLRGKSLGGSDNLQGLHADKSLRRMLEGAGMTVHGDVP